MPEGSKKSRLAVINETPGGDDSSLQLPEIDGAEYLVSLLHEAGLMLSNGMGPVPLTWQEINSWLAATELTLTVWEKLVIREMSEVYVSEFNKSSARLAPAPYMREVEKDDIDRAAVASKLLNVLRGFKRKPTPQ